MALVTASSLLVPVIGLVTAPILAHSLGVAGRGEAGAAIAPNLLIVGVATLGLPQALTYHVAKRPHLSRRALGVATIFGVLLGMASLVGAIYAAPFLSAGDADLARLMIIGIVLAIPALFVSLLRGAASGRQMWIPVAIERVLNSVVRLVAFIVLAVIGRLDITNAVLVMSIGPVIAGIAYVSVFRRPPPAPPELAEETPVRLVPVLLGFGLRAWLGSVATVVLGRLSQLLITPLSDVAQLGLFIVAVTISDIPWIVTQTVRDVAFGSNSADLDTERLTSTSRVATLVAFLGSAVIGLTLPLWIGVVFGRGFSAAIPTTWLLLICSVLAVPGLIAGAGLDSAGRPGIKSVTLFSSLVLNAIGLVVLVPLLGALGAALASFISVGLSTVVVLVAAAVILKIPASAFLIPRREDLAVLASASRSIARRLTPTLRR
jgi:O-antigen/teichoic acid export membrane protein